MKRVPYRILMFFVIGLNLLDSCKKSAGPPPPTPVDTAVTPPPVAGFDINSLSDTYADIASFDFYPKWTIYNVHDPSIKKFGDYYYCYSTDVAYGITVRSGIQVRRSRDLVQWEFVGWVFSSLPAQASAFITQNGGTPFDALWAPYIMLVNNEYRLYYSLSSAVSRLSVIGLATATNPEGPWTDKGIVVSSRNDNTTQTNAIDPTVVVTPSGDYWMYYGSAYDGIYILKLDGGTGLAATANDVGKRIAQRGFTGSSINGNIEGAEIIYNGDLKKYYLFIAYDWLETKYNVRVGRSDNPDGPFYDYSGGDLNVAADHIPMILAPYQFNGHGGWQGTAHCTVFDDGAGQYFMGHQGRPGVNKYFMDLHVRKIFWTNDQWPVVSPERYAWESNDAVAQADLPGNWEEIDLHYMIVPGFQNEQVSPDFQTSTALTISADGTFNGGAGNVWTYSAPWLTLNWNGTRTVQLHVQAGRDWENKKSTIVLSGLDNTGTAVWAKKL
jgi:arabinan endo-1,5-alpha-L-arabinosidase